MKEIQKESKKVWIRWWMNGRPSDVYQDTIIDVEQLKLFMENHSNCDMVIEYL